MAEICINQLRADALKKLLEERRAYQEAMTALASRQEASYSIQGSVNVTFRSMSEIRAALQDVNARIAALLRPATADGIRRIYPNYADTAREG